MLGLGCQRRELSIWYCSHSLRFGSEMSAVRSIYLSRADMYVRQQQIHLECIRSLQAAIHLVASRG